MLDKMGSAEAGFQVEACREATRARWRPKWPPKTPGVSRRFLLTTAKARRNERVCVLVRGQQYEPLMPGRACLSRIHGHMTREKAEELEGQGLAEWVKVEKISRKGKVTSERVLAIRLIPRRNWRAKVSPGDGRPMKVMQLVQ